MRSIKRAWLCSVLLTCLILASENSYAQDKDVPLSSSLTQNSEKWLIKIGMITGKKPPKLKFGDYFTDDRRGSSTTTEGTELIGPTDGKTTQQKFAFDLLNGKNESVVVEASVDMSNDSLRDVSVYMASSLKQDDLWILILKEPSGKNEMFLSDMVLTNGEEEISLSQVIGEPLGKGEVTAPKGITLMLEGMTLGTMQYDSGGTFAYKKYIWINQSADRHLQQITASVFAALLETAGYFEKVTLED